MYSGSVRTLDNGQVVKGVVKEEAIMDNEANGSPKTGSSEAQSKRITKDGTVQFRLDSDKMELLNGVADERRMGAGVLARMWVLERLEREITGKGDGQFDPMVAVADSIKALSSSMVVQSITSEVNKRLDVLEQKLDEKTNYKATLQNITQEVNKRIDQAEKEIETRTGVKPTVGNISEEINKRLDGLEKQIKQRFGVTPPHLQLPTVKGAKGKGKASKAGKSAASKAAKKTGAKVAKAPKAQAKNPKTAKASKAKASTR